MTSSAFHLAQVNIGRPLEPLGSARLAEFVAALGPINALADGSPGFVWRLQTEDGDATAVRVFDDDRLIVNMSVWESIEALAEYVYRSGHTAMMRRRREWFHHIQLYLALWWVPAGHLPSVGEAEDRLRQLEAHGPSPYTFTFQSPFPPPGSAATIDAREEDACPV